jgi:hypothetical protein
MFGKKKGEAPAPPRRKGAELMSQVMFYNQTLLESDSFSYASPLHSVGGVRIIY